MKISVSPGLPVQVNKQDVCIPYVQLMEDAQRQAVNPLVLLLSSARNCEKLVLLLVKVSNVLMKTVPISYMHTAVLALLNEC